MSEGTALSSMDAGAMARREMTRGQSLALHALSFASAGLGPLFVSQIVAVAKDREAVVLASSRAIGVVILGVVMELLAWLLVFFLVFVLPDGTFRGPGAAIAIFVVLLSPFQAYLVLGAFTLVLVGLGRDHESQTLRLLGRLGRPMAAHLAPTRSIFSPRTGA